MPYAGPQVGFLMLPDIGSGVWIEFEGGEAGSRKGQVALETVLKKLIDEKR